MRSKNYCLLIFLHTFLCFSVVAQTASEKSVLWKNVLEAKNDSTLAYALLEYGGLFCYTNYDSAEHYYRQSRDLALKKDFHKLYQKYISYQVEIFTLKGLFDSALFLARHGVDLAIEKKDVRAQGIDLSTIGNVHLYKGNNDSAGWYFLNATRYFEEIKDSLRLGQLYSNLAVVFENLEHYDRSLFYNRLALQIAKATKDHLGVGYSMNNIGSILKKQKHFDSATHYFEQSLPFAREYKDKILEKDVLMNLGFSELQLERYDKAEQYFIKSLELARQLENQSGITVSQKGIASIRIKQKKYNEAEKVLAEAITLAQANGLKNDLQDLYLLQYDAKLSNGKAGEALTAYRNHIQLKDSFGNLEVQKNIATLDKQYQAERKENMLLQKDLQIRNQNLQLETKNKWIWILSLAIVLSAVIVFLLWKFFKQKRIADAKQQELVQVQLSMQAKDEERNRIAKELHDDLGGTLSGIVVHSHFMIEQAQQSDPSALKKSIEKIQNAASEMITKLNDIVWLVNPKYDTLEKLVQRIEEFAMDMAKAKGMKIRIDTIDNPDTIALDTNARKNIYLICKEAINNAVKYSQASELSLNIARAGTDLNLLIEDNGKGFDNGLIKQGNGLSNMKERADEIGAAYFIGTGNTQGTRVSLNYKIPQ